MNGPDSSASGYYYYYYCSDQDPGSTLEHIRLRFNKVTVSRLIRLKI
jgi:hypothetical protein